MTAALIIIDMQVGMALAPANERNNAGAEGNIAALLAHWRAHKAPIVHVRHISRTPGSPFWPGQPGAEFQPALAPLPREHVVEKNVPDAFINSGLEKWLRVRGIGAVVIAGVSTSSSVEGSARTAGNLGFDTHVVSDACYAYAQIDYNGTPRSAEDMHAIALSNLRGEYATIMTTSEALAAFPAHVG